MSERTGPQILVSVASTYDGELTPPADIPRSFYAKVRQMRRDPTVKLARLASIAIPLSATWGVEEKDDAPFGARDFIDEQMQPHMLGLVKTAFLGCSDFGWQPFEKIFEVRGTTRLKKLKPLIQDLTSILVDDDGSYAGLRQVNRLHGLPFRLQGQIIDLTVSESLVINLDTEGTDWYGEPDMKTVEMAYDRWLESDAGARRYDRKIAGSHWIVYYPLGTSIVNGVDTDNFIIAKQILQSLEASGMIAVPRTLTEQVSELNENTPFAWKIELLSDTGAGSSGFTDRCKYLDGLKVRAYGMPERGVLEGMFGTKAEAQVHADVGIAVFEMRMRMLAYQINCHVVNQLLRLNYGPEAEDKVYMEPSRIADVERAYLQSLYDKVLADPNGFLLEFNEMDMPALRDRLNIPTKPTEVGDVWQQDPGLLPTAAVPAY